MAQDPASPPDPEVTLDRSVNPSQVPNQGTPQGDQSDMDGGEYRYWLRDGVTPYRTEGAAGADVFGRQADGWLVQNLVDRDKLWPSSPGEIAGMIGGRHRLTEPTKGAAPIDPGPDEDFAPVEPPDYLAEADSTADLPVDDDSEPDRDFTQPLAPPDAPPVGDLPSGGMNEQQIRDAGLRIDLPYDDPLPVDLKYADKGQQTWTPPPGFRQGMPPIDEKLAADLGVPRDLSQSQEGADQNGGDRGDAGT
jgi:hypothetical protein